MTARFIRLTEAGPQGWPFLVNVDRIVTVRRTPSNVSAYGSTDVLVDVETGRWTANVVETVDEVERLLAEQETVDAGS